MKSKVICVIMGGGRGSRLYPLTEQRCKPAIPLAGKYRLVDIPISNCLNSRLNRIYLLTQFNTASLHRHIQESYKFDPFGGGFVDILSAEQTQSGEHWYQGTSDAVRQNRHHFNAEENDLFLILSGDQLYRMDFRDIIEQHRRTGADVTISAKPIPDTEVSEFGVMRVEDDLSITEFVEKPSDPKVIQSLTLSEKLSASLNDSQSGKYCLASMGIYVFNQRVLFDALENTQADDFGKEVIPDLLGKVGLFSYIFGGYWEDIGTVKAFFEANLRLTNKNPPFDFFDSRHIIYTHARYLPASKLNQCNIDEAIIADGCNLTEVTLKRCVVGVRSVVCEGTTLEYVILLGQDQIESDDEKKLNSDYDIPNIGIGKNCHIENAIIDKNARIGNNVRLSPLGKPDLFEKGDVYVRDKVLIVGKNAVIPDNTVI